MTASLEEYLKTIYILIQTKTCARVTDIAVMLGYSKASVNKAIKLLKQQELVNYEAYSDITLTKQGQKEAENILKKHNTLKAFLTQVLEVDPKIAEQEAKNMKYAISEDTISKFAKYIKSIINVNELACDYNPKCEKCKSCVRMKTKNRFDHKE